MRNVEVKAWVRDLDKVKALARRLCGDKSGVKLRQCDTFFRANHGRLKLRVLEGDHQHNRRAQLIAYERADTTGPKLSQFTTMDVADPTTLKVDAKGVP